MSSDGKYFFFNRWKAWITAEQTDIYWIDSKAVFKPYVCNPVQDASVVAVKEFSYRIPEGSFKDFDGNELSFTAADTDGSPLPAWLRFDPQTVTFSGESPEETTLFLRITAQDANGNTASDNFILYVFPDTSKK